nr:hypothetical protein [Escherichia coli]
MKLSGNYPYKGVYMKMSEYNKNIINKLSVTLWTTRVY